VAICYETMKGSQDIETPLRAVRSYMSYWSPREERTQPTSRLDCHPGRVRRTDPDARFQVTEILDTGASKVRSGFGISSTMAPFTVIPHPPVRRQDDLPDWRERLACSQRGSHEVDLVVTGTERWSL
jgi:hypothetical protein